MAWYLVKHKENFTFTFTYYFFSTLNSTRILLVPLYISFLSVLLWPENVFDEGRFLFNPGMDVKKNVSVSLFVILLVGWLVGFD
jgi:hypothetical protein